MQLAAPLILALVSNLEGGPTFRAGRGLRNSPYLFMGIMLAICLGIAIPSILTAHGRATAANIMIMVVTMLGVMAFTGWLALLTAGTYMGSTTLREDGLLIAKPRRTPQLLIWQDIEALKVDVYSAGKGSSILGVRVKVRAGKDVFLPGMLKASVRKGTEFDERVQLIESAWQESQES